MKGYKASIGGKCKNQIYEVGKTYKMEFQSEGEIELCYSGFHFCEDPNNVFHYYEAIDNNIVVFEVEAIGTIKTSGDKSVTDELKVIREIPKQEYNNIFTNCEFKFDENNNCIVYKNQFGVKYEFKYDSNNNKIWFKHSNDYIVEYKYDSNNNLIWENDSFGDIYEYKYDSNNNMIWFKDSDGDITEYKYDSNNNLIWEKSYTGNVWEYKYDENNNLILLTNSHGDFREYKYDSNNNLIWEKGFNGIIKTCPSYKVISY